MATDFAQAVPAPPRAVALRLASAGFGYPDSAWSARFGALLRAAREGGGVSSAGAAKLEKALAAVPMEELAAEHFRLFGPAPACALELSFHATKDPFGQAKVLADLAGFYKAFGVESHERADALPTVLEFLAYLEVKRAHASERGWTEKRDIAADAAATLRAQFLSRLVRAVSRRLRSAGAPEFYLQLAAMVRALLGGAS